MLVARPAHSLEDGPTIAVNPRSRTPAAVLDAYADDALKAITEYESQLAGELDSERVGRLHYEIGRLYETVLGDLERASQHLDRALIAWPQHVPIMVSARRVRIRKGDAHRALELFDREIERCPDRPRKAALWLGKARVLDDRLNRPVEAREAYHNAVNAVEADPVLLKALEHADRMKKDWGAVSDDLAKLANAVPQDIRLRAALVARRAVLHETHLGDPDLAAELYESALEIDDQAAPEVIPVLRRLHESRKRWRDLVRTLAREAQLAKNAEDRAAALYRIGRVHAEHLGNTPEAIRAYEASAKAVPRPATLIALAQLHRNGDNDAALASTLTALVERLPSQHEQLALLLELGQLCHERLEDNDAAIAALEAARALDPASPPVLHQLGPLYIAQERWEPLVTMYEGEAQNAPEPSRRARAHAQAAEVLERIGRRPEATVHHQKALLLEPSRFGSVRALKRLFTHAGDHHKLIELYEQILDRVDQTRHITYLFEIGSLYAGPLDDPERAEQTYQRILKLQPQHLGAVQAIQTVAEDAQRWPQLLAALELEIDITDEPAQLVVLWHRAGDILSLRLNRIADAIERYRRALAIDAGHRPSLDALAGLYTDQRRWSDLVTIYEQQLEIDIEDSTAVALLQRSAEIYERELSQLDPAAQCFRRALELDPQASVAAQGLARILEQQQRWSGLVELRDRQRAAATEPDDKAHFAIAAGELYEDRLHNLERAAKNYTMAQELRPDDRTITEALRRVRTLEADWATLADELEHTASLQPDPAATNVVADLCYAAQIRSERLNDPRGAIKSWQTVLALIPHHRPALLALEPLLQQLGDWESLKQLYPQQVVAFQEPGAKVMALHEHARLIANHQPDDVDHCIDLYSSILALRPEDEPALTALESLTLRAAKPQALASVDARLAQLAPQAELRSAYLTRRAEAIEISGSPEALTIYREAMRLDPHNRGALRGLTRVAELLRDNEALADAAERQAEIASNPTMAADAWVRAGQIKAQQLGDRDGAIVDFDRALVKDPDHREAAQCLIEVMRSLERYRSLVERLIRAAESATKRERSAALWLEIASLQTKELDNRGGAQASLQRLLREQPRQTTAMLELGRLYLAERKSDEASKLLQRCLDQKPDEPTAHLAHSLLAEAYEKAGRAQESFTHYMAALNARPDDIGLLRRVAQLQLEHGHYAAAADVAGRLLDRSPGITERAQALGWVAQAQQGLGKTDEAIDTLAVAVALGGPRSDAAKVMLEHAQSTEHWERYIDALHGYLGERAPTGSERAALFAEIAQIQHDRLGDGNAALGTLIRGLQECDGDPQLRARLARRLAEQNHPAEALTQLQILLLNDASSRDHWHLLARCYQELGRTREYELALHGLVVMGAAGPDEIESTATWRPATGVIGPEALAPGAWIELQLGADPQTAVGNLLAAICDGLGKLRPADLSGWGVASRDRIAPRSDHPLRLVVDPITALFGLEDVDIYLHQHQDRGVGVENTSRPALMLPQWLPQTSPSQQTFLVTQAVAHIARGTYPAYLMTPSELALTIAAAIRSSVADYGSGLAAAEVLDEQARLLMRGVPRRKRKVLESAAQVCAPMQLPDPNTLAFWLLQTARRLAAIVADDLIGIVELIGRMEKLEDKPGPERLAHSPVIADLMRIWASEPAMTVRSRVGLIPSGAR